jgi:hypothetical protein
VLCVIGVSYFVMLYVLIELPKAIANDVSTDDNSTILLDERSKLSDDFWAFLFGLLSAAGSLATAIALYFVRKQSKLTEQEIRSSTPRPRVGTSRISLENMGSPYGTELYVSNNFLLSTAAEVYHRVLLEGNSVKKEQNIAFTTNLIESINKLELAEYTKEQIRIRIKRTQSLTSRERMEEVYDKFRELLPVPSKKIENKDEFIKKIVKYRNALTHGDVPFDNYDVHDLFWQYKNLQLILQLCIFLEIGFSITEIKEMYINIKYTFYMFLSSCCQNHNL